MQSKHPASQSLTRRSFITSTAAVALGVTAGGLILPRAASAQRKRGGHLRIGLGGGSTTDTLDPLNWSDGFMYMLGFAVRGNLVEVLADGTAVPELAESFESSDDGTNWTFRLRPGLTFSNGKTVTASDCVASINRIRNGQAASGASTLLVDVIDVVAKDEKTVSVTLSHGNFDFPYVMADYTLGIMPYDGDTPDLESGAGAYLLKSFVPGERAVLERNPNAFKQGHFDSIEMISIADANARQSALMAGQLDAINRVDLKTAAMMANRSSVVIGSVPSRQYYAFCGNGLQDPFNSNDVRLALKYGIDRAAMVEKILHGYGTLGNDQPITPAYKYHNPDVAVRAYDPDKARFHLQKAGLDGITLTLSGADAAFPGAVNAGLLYAEQISGAGVSIRVERTPDDGYWSNVWMKKPFFASYWSGRSSEDSILTTAWSKDSDANDSFMSVPEVEDLLISARKERDDSTRRTLYGQIQSIISEQYSVVIPMFANYVHAARDKVVTGETVSGVAEMDGARCLERWSFA